MFTVVHDHLDPPRSCTKGVLPSVTQRVCAHEHCPLNADDEDTPLDVHVGGKRERKRERERERERKGEGKREGEREEGRTIKRERSTCISTTYQVLT